MKFAEFLKQEGEELAVPDTFDRSKNTPLNRHPDIFKH